MDRIRVTGTAQAVEEIAWKYRLKALGNDRQRANDLSGYVEQVYGLNPGLADKGPLIPVGTEIIMPDPFVSVERPANRLWG
ncbi:MAG: tail protein X [Pseudomonadota bacterium]